MGNAVAAVLLAASFLSLTPGTLAASGKVSIYNWNDYIGPDTVSEFKKKTGLEVSYDVYDSAEALESKLAVGRSGYDLVVPTAEPTLARLIASKAVQPLDKSKVANLANLDPELMKRVEAIDPGNKYGVIYQWGTVGVGLIPEKIKALAPDAPLDSWDLLFKPELVAKLAVCGVTLMDSQSDVIPTALNYLKLDPNSEKPEDLAKAEALLMEIRPFIKAFVTGQNIANLVGGDACVVFAYSGDALQAKGRAAEAKSAFTIDYVAPREGVQLWFDIMAIPADAPNPDGAHAFINYVLQPDVMADISNTTQYANAVPASWPKIDAAVRDNPAIFPSAQAKAKMFTVRAVSQEAERARNRVWTRVKSGH